MTVIYNTNCGWLSDISLLIISLHCCFVYMVLCRWRCHSCVVALIMCVASLFVLATLPSIRWDSRSESNEPKTKVVLFTQSRSGSSFICKVLQQRPDRFYSFEPLRFISFNEESNFITHDERLGSNVSEIISNLLQCLIIVLLRYKSPH